MPRQDLVEFAVKYFNSESAGLVPNLPTAWMLFIISDILRWFAKRKPLSLRINRCRKHEA